MVEARRRLAGQLTSDLLSMPHNNLLEGAIILEELVKVYTTGEVGGGLGGIFYMGTSSSFSSHCA